MIDPTNITNYNRSIPELEEFLLFCVAVAGKNATVTAANLERLLNYGKQYVDGTPFEIIESLDKKYNLAELIRSFGFGCHTVKSKGFIDLYKSKLNLKECTVDDLEKIHGIGMKSSRFFLLHSRKNPQVACLDTHILKWLGLYSGYDVPKQTPTKKKYLILEKAFLEIANALKIDPAVLDLKIWNISRGSFDERVD